MQTVLNLLPSLEPDLVILVCWLSTSGGNVAPHCRMKNALAGDVIWPAHHVNSPNSQKEMDIRP